jgi:hypothetical protein
MQIQVKSGSEWRKRNNVNLFNTKEYTFKCNSELTVTFVEGLRDDTPEKELSQSF